MLMQHSPILNGAEARPNAPLTIRRSVMSPNVV